MSTADERPRGGAPDVFASFPNTAITHDNVAHYRGLLERRLLINQCQRCDLWIYPHRPLCPRCWSWDVLATPVSGRGVIYMFTAVHETRVAEGGLPDSPLPLVAIELDEQVGLRYLSSVVDCTVDDLQIGQAVELCWLDTDPAPSARFRLVAAT